MFGSLHENNSRCGSPGQNYQNYSCSLSGFTILSAVLISTDLFSTKFSFFLLFLLLCNNSLPYSSNNSRELVDRCYISHQQISNAPIP